MTVSTILLILAAAGLVCGLCCALAARMAAGQSIHPRTLLAPLTRAWEAIEGRYCLHALAYYVGLYDVPWGQDWPAGRWRLDFWRTHGERFAAIHQAGVVEGVKLAASEHGKRDRMAKIAGHIAPAESGGPRRTASGIILPG